MTLTKREIIKATLKELKEKGLLNEKKLKEFNKKLNEHSERETKMEILLGSVESSISNWKRIFSQKQLTDEEMDLIVEKLSQIQNIIHS